MRMTFSVAAVLSLVAAFPVPVLAADAAAEPGVQLAMTLEEMNCASSDVQAWEDVSTTLGESVTPDEALLASGSSGTNGIPCPKRDPKAPPRQRS